MEGEILELNSGKILALDLFMLTNDHFLSSRNVEHFGAFATDAPVGKYRIFRKPREKVVLFFKVDSADEERQKDMADVLAEQAEYEKERLEKIGTVNLDTRCLAFVDEELLKNQDVLSEVSELRKASKFKPSRDELRRAGAVVRYGFSEKPEVFHVSRLQDDAWVFFGEEEDCG